MPHYITRGWKMPDPKQVLREQVEKLRRVQEKAKEAGEAAKREAAREAGTLPVPAGGPGSQLS